MVNGRKSIADLLETMNKVARCQRWDWEGAVNKSNHHRASASR